MPGVEEQRGARAAVGLKKPRRSSGAMLAQWSPTSTDEERREFYQRRLALFAGVFFWVFVILLVWLNGMYVLLPELRPSQWGTINVFAVVALVADGILWRFVLRRRELSLPALFAWDIIIAEVIGVVLAVAAVLSPDKPWNVVSMLIWAYFTVFARVCVIPSRGRRTLLISASVVVPQVLAIWFIVRDRSDYMGSPSAAVVIASACYSVVVVLLAAMGSEIIYGLRKKVGEAQQLGQYTLGEIIGSGGMGTVYKARHAMLRRPTALKLLKPEKAGRENLTRFEREVQLTSELTHPNTIAIYDYGRSPDGVFYYTMEFLDGIDLERLVARHGPQPASRVVHILAQICGALDEAHDKGLIHRDVKPANVILCWRGKVPDVAKVLDFGLVKDLEDVSISSTGAIAGTPAYLAPEAINSPDKVGPHGDLYALGAVGYFLLTGGVVFPAANVIEMCVHHVSSVPEPMSSRTDNPIPDELEQLILECLEKEPDSRPASAAALRERLLALEIAGTWTDNMAASWWRENPLESGTAEHGGPRTPSTMTVDLAGRDGEIKHRLTRGNHTRTSTPRDRRGVRLRNP